MENICQDILKMNESDIDRLSAMGLLRSTAMRDIEIYAYYLKEIARNNGKMRAVLRTSEKFYISEDRAKGIIYKIRKAHHV